MDWVYILIVITACLFFGLIAGFPVFITFLCIDILGITIYMGGINGLSTLIRSMSDSIGIFTLTPVPLFIIMGEVIFISGMATRAIDVVERLLYKLPGRLGLVAIGGGALFDCLSGSALGTCAMFGSLLVPEMMKRKYSKYMSMGPVMAGSALAVVIPPSTLAIVLASQASVSIGKLLIAGFVPGMLLSGLFAGFIIIGCILKPSMAPSGSSMSQSSTNLLFDFFKYLCPLTFIVLAVLGSIFAGIATPTEASALGGIASFILAACYGKLNWDVIKRSTLRTLDITTMIFMIVAGSVAFSQLLAFTGVTRGIVEVALSMSLPPIFVVAMMIIILILMGTMIDQMSMIMIGVPMFMPIVKALNFDPIWFGLLMLLSITIGLLTPPFGLLCFIMKGVTPPGIGMSDVYYSILPYLLLAFLGIFIILIFPEIALWLPNTMAG